MAPLPYTSCQSLTLNPSYIYIFSAIASRIPHKGDRKSQLHSLCYIMFSDLSDVYHVLAFLHILSHCPWGLFQSLPIQSSIQALPPPPSIHKTILTVPQRKYRPVCHYSNFSDLLMHPHFTPSWPRGRRFPLPSQTNCSTCSFWSTVLQALQWSLLSVSFLFLFLNQTHPLQ